VAKSSNLLSLISSCYISYFQKFLEPKNKGTLKMIESAYLYKYKHRSSDFVTF